VIGIFSKCFNVLCAVKRDVVIVGWIEEGRVEVGIETEMGGGKEAKVYNNA
jgi:hypothetical protein